MRQPIALSLAAVLAAAPALADNRDTIITSCAQTLGLPPSGCDCIADKAEAEFDEQEMAFFISVITKDKATSAKLRGEMTVNQLTKVGGRMTKMPAECAN